MTSDRLGQYTEPEGRLSERAGRGAAWTMAAQGAIRISGFATFVILARILAPEDFGAIALAQSIALVFTIVAEFGLAEYLVKGRAPTQVSFSTAFWVSLSGGAVLGAVLVGAAWPVSEFLSAPQAAPVIAALALAVVMDSAKSVPNALLKRRFEFGALAGRLIVAVVAGQLVAIAMAVGNAGVWALVGQVWTVSLVSLVITWIAAKWRPSAEFSLSEAVRMTRFGIQVIGARLVTQSVLRGIDALVSRYLGLTQLGYFSMASRMTQMTVDMMSVATTTVAAPLYASVKRNHERFVNSYMAGQNAVVAVSTPLLLGLSINAELIVPALLGNDWLVAVPVLRVLALVGAVRVFASSIHGPLLNVIGRPELNVYFALGTAALALPTTWLTAQVGLEAVAIGLLAVFLVIAPIQHFVSCRAIRVPYRTAAGKVGRVLVASGLSVIPGAGWSFGLAGRLPDLLLAASSFIVIAVSQAAALYVLDRQTYRQILGMGRAVTRRAAYAR